MNDLEAQPPAEPTPPVAPELPSGATLVSGPLYDAQSAPAAPLEPPPPLPDLRSKDGRVVLTDSTVTVLGNTFLLLELERAELTPVRWILWYLLGGLGLATVMIAFLQNWLRTGPAMFGMALTALLLAYGHRGTNRLRLHRLGREMVNFALPGDTLAWQRLVAEVNRRIYRVHDWAAREAVALLAAADEANRQAAQAAADAAGPDKSAEE
ncbi:hypothetical protein I2I05_15570 [Hymenobacter sp. BT683]|uniref:SLATT domain-containing protein n=1 Tax=Hymenobacter jeongseonensis TaxID=2791027 RepID=A0ABS0IKE0_9BACT|nr:hypothetical protein [Hymenobacter jeongseonensis]MBF9238821.1 hypothetical protein [Hymenobacter jeongseonensis]